MNRVIHNYREQVGEAIFLYEVDMHIKRRGQFECKCGKKFIAPIHKVRNFEIKSCGCAIGKHPNSRNHTIHGGRSSCLYNVWCAMKARCYNKNRTQYDDYGGKGVIVCEEWKNDFKAFEIWALGNGWRKGLQLDKDIKGDGLLYSPDACCFVTAKQNSGNRKNTKMIEYNGIRKTASEWADEIGCTITLLHTRLNRGWTFDRCYSMKK